MHTQHFLLSAAARTLSLAKVARMSDEEAREAFKAIRWADTEGEPVCPHCDCAAVNTYKSRPIFKCKGCGKQFSVTSGTIFANRKMPLRDILLAIAIFTNGAKGYAALQLSRDLDCQYKTAFVLAHKIREALALEQDTGEVLKGEVEVDGMYAGGHIRPENKKEDRIDRRLAKHQNGKRKVVVVMRERNGRTLPFVFKSESAAVPAIISRVDRTATVFADEASHWDALHSRFAVKRINHSVEYSNDEACTNHAESFFSRLRRAEVGTHHHIAADYLDAYAAEMAWREDHRRVSNGEQFMRITRAAATAPVSRQWAGYWQRGAL